MPSFNDYASTEDILKGWAAEPEEWKRFDSYKVDGKLLDLLQSSFGRWMIVRTWLTNDRERTFVFQSEDAAMDCYLANRRVMDRKWWAAQPPPAGFGRF